MLFHRGLKAARQPECEPCQHASPQMARNPRQHERVQINGKQSKIKYSICEPYLPTNVMREEVGKTSSKILIFFQKVSFIPLGEQRNLGSMDHSYKFHPQTGNRDLFYKLKNLKTWELPFDTT